MTPAQSHLIARNPSAHLNQLRPCIPQSTIIAMFFWPYSRADIACMLRTTPGHIQHTWLKAKEQGRLPRVHRPAKGFNLETLFLAHVQAGRAA